MLSNPTKQHDAWIDGQKNTFTKVGRVLISHRYSFTNDRYISYSDIQIFIFKYSHTSSPQWANNYLAKKELVIVDLYEDLRDGLILIALLQEVSGEPVALRYVKRPKLRIQKMENLNLAFQFMMRKGLTLTNIGSADILDGNNKLVLGLLWTLIKTYQVTAIDVDGISGKAGLLLWCQRALAPYDNIDMHNFTTSWNNGLAFCGLIHKFHPDILDYPSLHESQAVENVELAFHMAESHLHIPRLLNVSDIAHHAKPDEKIVMTYVSQMFQALTAESRRQQAVTTITRAIQITQRHEEFRQQYINLGLALDKWFCAQVDEFKSPVTFRSLDDIQQALTEFYTQYKSHIRAKQDARVVQLQSIRRRFLASCQTNQRAVPIDCEALERIIVLQEELNQLELVYEQTLRGQFEQFKLFEFQLQQMQLWGKKLESWIDAKRRVFVSTDETIHSSADAERLLEQFQHSFRKHDVPKYEKVLQRIQSAAKKVSASSDMVKKHEAMESAMNWIVRLEQQFHECCQVQSHAYLEQLQQKLSLHQKLEQLSKRNHLVTRTTFSLLEELTEEMDSMDMDIEAIQIITTKSRSVESAQDALEKFKQNIYDKLDQLIVPSMHQLQDNVNEIDQLIRTIHSSTTVDPHHHHMKVKELGEYIKLVSNDRDTKLGQLEQAVVDAQRQDDLCRSFSRRATTIREACHCMSTRLNELILDGENPTADMETIRTLRSQCLPPPLSGPSSDSEDSSDATDLDEKDQVHTVQLGAQMQQLNAIQIKLDRGHIFSNDYSTDSIQSLHALVASVQQSLEDQLDIMENALIASRAGDLTREQLSEIQHVFSHFDTHGRGTLTREELGCAAQALGLTDASSSVTTFDEDESLMTFDAFTKFCAGQFAASGSTEVDVEAAFHVLTTAGGKTDDHVIETRVVDQYFTPHLIAVRSGDGGGGQESKTLTMAEYIKSRMGIIPDTGEPEQDHDVLNQKDKRTFEKRHYRDFISSLF